MRRQPKGDSSSSVARGRFRRRRLRNRRSEVRILLGALRLARSCACAGTSVLGPGTGVHGSEARERFPADLLAALLAGKHPASTARCH
jgi:hypothetical protein